MKKPPTPKDPLIRKTIALHQSDWADIAQMKDELRVVRESEAIRHVVRAGVKALRGRKV
jgi:hypothetical protein